MTEFPKVWFIVYSIIRLILIVLCIVILVFASQAMTKGSVNVDPYMQVKSEWLQKPLVDIYVSTEPCQNGEKNLINYKWSGTTEGCWVDPNSVVEGRGYRMTKGRCTERCTHARCAGDNITYGNTSKYLGDRLLEIPPIFTQSLQGKHLCGTMAGTPFS
jgi:hypothetical protein